MTVSSLTKCVLFLLIWGLVACGGGGNGNSGGNAQPVDDGWVGVWATSAYTTYPLGPLEGIVPAPLDSITTPTAFPDEQAVDQSFRMIVHPTLGGEVMRLQFSNAKGDQPVTLNPVTVALRLADAAIQPGTEVEVTFDGTSGVTIAPGDEVLSDAVSFPFAVGDDLAISFQVVGQSGLMTWHAVSFDLQYLTPPGSGDVTSDVSGLSFTERSLGWFFLSGVDVLHGGESLGAIVTLGDSITDGAYQTPGTNTRWPDFLAGRLQAQNIPMGVLNVGVNSNTVVAPVSENRGNPAVIRFDRDVLARAGVKSLVIFEGTNDLTAGATAEEIIDGLKQLVDRAHAAGLCVVLGTIMPRDDLIFGWDRATMEEPRQVVNAAIRMMAEDGTVEGVADFDAVMGSPLDPTRPNPVLYSPDLLHPTTVGFSVMADAVPLEDLVPPLVGQCM